MRKKWKHRAAGALAAAALAAGVAAAAYMPGAAADPIDLEKPCALTVNPSGQDFAEDLAGADVVIDLYKVADAVKVAGYDTYTYVLQPGYEALAAGLLEADGSRKEITNEDWDAIEQEAARIALNGGTLPSEHEPVVAGAPAGTPIRTLDAADASGSNALGCGLYLVIARGSGIEDYVKTVTDEEDREKLATWAQSERHVYTFAPELISLPGKAPDEDGALNTANPGEWLYELTGEMSVRLKPAQGYRYGQLEIVKTLMEYEDKSPATFVFDVEATLDGETVYSDVVSLTFTAPGQKTTLIDKIPVGAEVTVTEVYKGASYEVAADGTVNVTIEAEDVVQAAFTNTYTHEHRDGYGITNSFTYDEDEWQWNHWVEEAE